MAFMAIGPNDVIEVRTWFTYDASRLMNVFHYQLPSTATPTTNGEPIIQSFLNIFHSSFFGVLGVGPLPTRISDRTQLDYIDAQVIYPNRQYYVRNVYGESMSASGTYLPSDTGITLTLRAAVVGRGRAGRKSFSGQLTDNLNPGNASVWTDTWVTSWQAAVAPVITAPIHVAIGPGYDFYPRIFDPRHPANICDIAGVVVQPEVRVARRRQFRVGI